MKVKRRDAAIAAAAVAALGAAALYVQYRSRRAEQETPPVGRFIEVDGVRLHYVERGSGRPVVLLHGNGGIYQDFATSGLVDRLAQHYRVIAFDRPGFGYSSRPRWRLWTPEAQAALVHRTLRELGIRQSVVVGHSWGTMVAAALALEHPDNVKSLVLLAGYYFPTVRADAAGMAVALGSPLLGDLLRLTIAPIVSRLLWEPILAKLFGPNPAPRRFRRQFPRWLALRPGHLRAIGAEMALMIPAAARLSRRYGELRMPVFIMAGDSDRLASPRHSRRLHQAVPGSRLYIFPGVGHMIHHVATDAVAQAIEQAAGAADCVEARPRAYQEA